MAQHDFRALFAQYPAAIESMPASFTSHEFILNLAQNNQAEYVEALHSYRQSRHGSGFAPFKAVHTILSQHLQEYPTLIRHVGPVASKDIFGQANSCAKWTKI
jgi:hypothetical protein